MNQILSTKIISKKQKLKQLLVQFFISIFSLFIVFFCILKHKIDLEKEKNYAENISKNYHIYKLYSNYNEKQQPLNENDILGNIIIPKLDINYPFFNGISDDLLKIAPCRFYGAFDVSGGNLCIAGHNYNDNRFFSNIDKLCSGDLIIIEDNLKNFFYYYVSDVFEINEEDIQMATNKLYLQDELTLVTCNNYNDKRIVIKAKNKTESKY